MQRRKDTAGKVLQKGESYREKEKRYVFRWTDKIGKTHSIYGKSLNELRQSEQKVLHDLSDGIRVEAQNIRLNDLYKRWIKTKAGIIKPSTQSNYEYMYEHFVEQGFGRIRVKDINKSTIKEFYYSLVSGDTKTMAINTLERIHEVLHQVLGMAVDDELIRKNPSDNVIGDMKRAMNYETPKRKALTLEQQNAFMNYIKTTPKYLHWLPLFTFFLGTGCRVGEVVGLRWEDIHKNGENETGIEYIDINHNMVYYAHGRDERTGRLKNYYVITTPKTEAGIRRIPLVPAVKNAIMAEKSYQQEVDISCNFIVDGYTDFVFLNREGKAHNPQTINRAIHRITKDYNMGEMDRAEKERREPILLPPFSCHTLRHTFSTRLWESCLNTKMVQSAMGYADFSTAEEICNGFSSNTTKGVGGAAITQAMQAIMGHADIVTTMDIYTDVTLEAKCKALSNLSTTLGL